MKNISYLVTEALLNSHLGAVDYFGQAMDLISKGVVAAGSVVTIIGCVQLGGALKEHSGPSIQNAVFTIAGGGVIFLAGAWLANVTM